MSAKDGAVLFEKAVSRETEPFAKLLTWIERSSASDVLAVPELLNPKQACFRLGITGPPGAGKSTLVAGLIREFRAFGLTVGVIAVDPSSPFTRGAILGDRIRYSDHTLDAGVFIRSLGTRGSLGGLSSAAFLMARAFDACAFDILLIETVGVGQTELDVLHVADQVCVVLVPESGDSVQAMKAGLMEIADIFVVNKSDRPGADGLAREIEASVHDGESKREVQVLKTVATENRGVNEVVKVIEEARRTTKSLANRAKPTRLREEAKALLRGEWENQIQAKLLSLTSPEDLLKLLK